MFATIADHVATQTQHNGLCRGDSWVSSEWFDRTRVLFGFYGYSWVATLRALVQVLKQNYQIHDTGEQPDLKVLMTGLTIIEQRMKDLMSIAENEKHHAKLGPSADAKHPQGVS